MNASKTQHFGLKRTHFQLVFVAELCIYLFCPLSLALSPPTPPSHRHLCLFQSFVFFVVNHLHIGFKAKDASKYLSTYENMEKIFISFSHHHKLYAEWVMRCAVSYFYTLIGSMAPSCIFSSYVPLRCFLSLLCPKNWGITLLRLSVSNINLHAYESTHS